MATKFPSMISWMDDKGSNELHRLHEEFAKETGERQAFDYFVQGIYESEKMGWEESLNGPKCYHVPYAMDEDGDICLESAKIVLKEIINEGIRKGRVAEIILEDELAPDHDSAVAIANDFIYKIIPAIQDALVGLK